MTIFCNELEKMDILIDFNDLALIIIIENEQIIDIQHSEKDKMNKVCVTFVVLFYVVVPHLVFVGFFVFFLYLFIYSFCMNLMLHLLVYSCLLCHRQCFNGCGMCL